MPTYVVKVECEYYVEVEADSESQALENAVEADYSLGSLQNFNYSIDEVIRDEEEEEEDD